MRGDFMETVKKIKATLDRKAQLEQNIAEANRAVNHSSMSDLVTCWTNINGRLDVRISRAAFTHTLNAQIELDKVELAKIDKQLDAIGALMGASNV
jgi:hypothetical protein